MDSGNTSQKIKQGDLIDGEKNQIYIKPIEGERGQIRPPHSSANETSPSLETPDITAKLQLSPSVGEIPDLDGKVNSLDRTVLTSTPDRQNKQNIIKTPTFDLDKQINRPRRYTRYNLRRKIRPPVKFKDYYLQDDYV